MAERVCFNCGYLCVNVPGNMKYCTDLMCQKKRIAVGAQRRREANLEKATASERHARRRYREAHPERIAEQQRRYYEANAQKIAKKNQHLREVNAEAIAEQRRRWRESNPAKVKKSKLRYKSKLSSEFDAMFNKIEESLR